MLAYVVYTVRDYAIPVCITGDKNKAIEYMEQCKDNRFPYWIDEIVISNEIWEFDD